MTLKIRLFKLLIKDLLNISGDIDNGNNQRIVKAVFGCSVVIIAIAWKRIKEEGLKPTDASPVHLLYALALLKTYKTEDNYAIKFSVTRVTFRKWSWILVLALSRLDCVSINRIEIVLCKS